jgi:hypothetical protein
MVFKKKMVPLMAKPMVLGFAISGPIIHTNFSGEKIPKKYFELFLILI